MAKMGGDPDKINPEIPVDLVIDHSVQVDKYASDDALEFNMNKEFERNLERYKFLKWAQDAFDNYRAVPPATGIVHQVNLEYLAPVVHVNETEPTEPVKESFKNCSELRAVYPGGVMSGHPAYESQHDADNDGWACEPVEDSYTEKPTKQRGERIWLIYEPWDYELQTRILEITQVIDEETDELTETQEILKESIKEYRSSFTQTDSNIRLEVERINHSIAAIDIKADTMVNTQIGRASCRERV